MKVFFDGFWKFGISQILHHVSLNSRKAKEKQSTLVFSGDVKNKQTKGLERKSLEKKSVRKTSLSYFHTFKKRINKCL